MTDGPFPKDITDPGRIEPVSPLGTGGKPLPKESFQSLMQQPSGTSAEKTSGVQSPFDVIQNQSLAAGGANLNSLLTQVNTAQTTLGDLTNDLNTPKLKLKQSHRWMLNKKLSSANTNLRSANEKLGGNPGPAVDDQEAQNNPITRFISFVTDGQRQLEEAKQQIHSFGSGGNPIKPADMLLIQIKLSKAQTELEYSSVLLSKAVDATRTLMGVQL